MRNVWKFVVASVVSGFLAAAAPPTIPYAEGQIWEYRTRPEDRGSLLKIQKIETLEGGEQNELIYHVSLIGLRFTDLPIASELQHAPFSKASLDASVLRLSSSGASFPDPTAGIAEWRSAKGGVFVISVADAVRVAEETIRPERQQSSVR